MGNRGAAHPYGASRPNPPSKYAEAGSRSMSARVPATAPVEPRAAGDRYRSSLCARIVAATERARQKIDLQCLLADLGVQRLEIRRRLALIGRRGEDLGGTLQQLVLPLRDLVGGHIEALRQLRQRLFVLKRFQRHLRFEARRAFAARSFL